MAQIPICASGRALTTLLVPLIFETNFSFQAGSIMVMEHWDDTHTKHSLSLSDMPAN
jgi:hypothetical protein